MDPSGDRSLLLSVLQRKVNQCSRSSVSNPVKSRRKSSYIQLEINCMKQLLPQCGWKERKQGTSVYPVQELPGAFLASSRTDGCHSYIPYHNYCESSSHWAVLLTHNPLPLLIKPPLILKLPPPGNLWF